MLMQRVGQNLASFHRPPVQPLGSLLTLVDDADAGEVLADSIATLQFCAHIRDAPDSVMQLV